MVYQYETIADEYIFQDFLKDLYNAVDSTSSYEVYRSKGSTQFGIDVYSPKTEKAIQAKKKSNLRSDKSLIKESIDELNNTINETEKFPHKIAILVFATTTKKYSKVQDHAISLSNKTKFEITYLSWEEIQKEIHKFENVRKKYYPHLTTDKSYPKELVNTALVDMNMYIGRAQDLSNLNTLITNSRVLAIKSIGGVGKTTLARVFYHTHLDSFDYLIWIDYLTSFKRDISASQSLCSNLKLNFSELDSVEKRYSSILNSVLSLKGKILLVIDDIQHDPEFDVINELTKFLKQSETKILITTRHKFERVDTYELNSLGPHEGLRVFKKHCFKVEDEKKIITLLEVINFNTLLIVLIAKMIENAFGLSIEKVIASMAECDISDYDFDVEVEYSDGNKYIYSKIYSQIETAFSFSKLSDFDSFTLHLFSILPDTYSSIEEIFSFFGINRNDQVKVVNSINRLYKLGFIDRKGDNITMHALLQDVVRIQSNSYAHYLFILVNLCSVLDKHNSTFSSNGYRLQTYAEAIISKLKGAKAEPIKQPLLMLKNNLFILYRYLGEHEKAKKIGLDISTAVEGGPIFLGDDIFMGTVHHNIATYFMDEKSIDKAEPYFKKAIAFYEKTESINIVQSYNGLLQIYSERGDFVDAIQCCGKALEAITSKNTIEYDHILATVMNNFAMLNFRLGYTDKAPFYIHQAIILFRESTNATKNNAQLAGYYCNAAIIYSAANQHEMAIQWILHAIDYQANLHLENDHVLIYYYKIASEVYLKAGMENEFQQLQGLLDVLKNKS